VGGPLVKSRKGKGGFGWGLFFFLFVLNGLA